MAIYTTFFLCQTETLSGGFPGWKLPLAAPVYRKFCNPFTGEESIVETREPDWPEEAASEIESEYQVASIAGRYEDYLESRLPPFVRSCPHWAAKNLTEVQLAPLFDAAGSTGSM